MLVPYVLFYSSFNKFVQCENYDINWGSNDDVKHIETLDY